MDTALLGEEGIPTIQPTSVTLGKWGVYGSCQWLHNSQEGSQPASTKTTSVLLKAKVK